MLTSLPQPKLTARNLKLLAMTCMFIDHVGAIIINNLIHTSQPANNNLETIYIIARLIGRMSFPLYCFLLVEGFHHTRNKSKYVQRLLLFALISEIPYNIAFYGEWLHPAHNNIFLTLSLGFLMMWAISVTQEQTQKMKPITRTILRNALSIFICCLTIVISNKLHTDYKCSGIIAIYILFILRSHPVTATFLATLTMSILIGDPIQMASLLTTIPITLYNGQKGISGNRYLFYAFYPAHLLILTAFAHLIQSV